ncbi:unnamed protein product, partial [Mesorhabditis spiculigera]
MDYTKYGDSQSYSNYMNDYARLYQEIFTNRSYNKLMSPVYGLMPDNISESDTPPLNIQIKLFYIQIVGLEAQTQVLSTIYQIKMKWRDPRLAWNPEDYGGIKQIYLSESLLWLPDTNVGTATGASITRPDEIRALQVLNTGRVKWPTQYFTENICRMQVSKFPFDTQICTIPFLTWAYEAKFLNLTGSMSDIQIQNQGNGEWHLIDLTTIYTSYGQGEDGIAKMNYQLRLRRVPNFYVYVIAIPCFILTMLSALGIGLTSLVSMTVLLQMLAEAIPKTVAFPLLGIYVVLCVGITSLSCVLVVVFPLDNYHRKSNLDVQRSIEKQKSMDSRSLFKLYINEHIFTRHFTFHVIFQLINLIGFIIFLSFWN